MDKFDEKVIGYESTKDILRQILDILKRPEVYERKGISIPRGLLMESDPGLGKSLLASILIEESERKPFVFRKTSNPPKTEDTANAILWIAILVLSAAGITGVRIWNKKKQVKRLGIEEKKEEEE